MGTYTSPLLDQYGLADQTNQFEREQYLTGQTTENDVPATASKTHDWTQLGNGQADDGSHIIITSSGGSYIFPYLRFSNFGFDIPTGATLLGVEVVINWGSNGSDYTEQEVNLAWDASAATLSTTNKASGASRTSGSTATFGGAADLWGETSGTTLTVADVNSSNFGLVYKVGRSTNSTSQTFRIDYLKMAVTYSVTEAGDARITQTEALVFAESIGDIKVTQVYAEVMIEPGSSKVYASGRRGITITSS